ncbi:AAA family ATPase [Granulicoccus sp. GXG6511]|uniref:AAA family ATPase n=1 Tax=Granulicoccus sp. GXG6511 TaxID=3381351 RepID=UPI003D7DBA55
MRPSLTSEVPPMDGAMRQGRVVVITGAMAAGKSTVAELLAQHLPHSVHVRGDSFRRMIVNGQVAMTPDPSPAAIEQLHLRYQLAAVTADTYAAHGFDAVVQDVIIGAELEPFIARIRTPDRFLVVLSPSVSVLEWREQKHRRKEGYVHFSAQVMDAALRKESARIGYWLDSSSQTPEETVADILSNLDRARV